MSQRSHRGHTSSCLVKTHKANDSSPRPQVVIRGKRPPSGFTSAISVDRRSQRRVKSASYASPVANISLSVTMEAWSRRMLVGFTERSESHGEGETRSAGLSSVVNRGRAPLIIEQRSQGAEWLVRATGQWHRIGIQLDETAARPIWPIACSPCHRRPEACR